MFEMKRATPDDAGIAFEIRRLAILHQCIGAYSEQQMLGWTKGLASDGYDTLMQKHFYLGCVEGEPVATGMLDLEQREIGAIFIHPDFMRRGLGKCVLHFLEALAQDLGLEEVCLDATLNAADFYRRCGYTGEGSAIYQSPSGLQLACVPMLKKLKKV